MSMSVSNTQRNRGNASYYDLAFRRVWEDHISQDVSPYIGSVSPLSARQTDKFKGDFYGLLIELSVKEEHHWYTLRINDLHSTADFVEQWEFVKLIDVTSLQTVLERHLSTRAQL